MKVSLRSGKRLGGGRAQACARCLGVWGLGQDWNRPLIGPHEHRKQHDLSLLTGFPQTCPHGAFLSSYSL